MGVKGRRGSGWAQALLLPGAWHRAAHKEGVSSVTCPESPRCCPPASSLRDLSATGPCPSPMKRCWVEWDPQEHLQGRLLGSKPSPGTPHSRDDPIPAAWPGLSESHAALSRGGWEYGALAPCYVLPFRPCSQVVSGHPGKPCIGYKVPEDQMPCGWKEGETAPTLCFGN